MGYHYEIEPERQLVNLRMWGAITREEISAVRAAVAADPRFIPGFSELIDLRELTSTDNISAADIWQIASSNVDPVKRRAFVVLDPAAYGLVRMFDGLRVGLPKREEVRLFKTVTDAEAWLGLFPGK